MYPGVDRSERRVQLLGGGDALLQSQGGVACMGYKRPRPSPDRQSRFRRCEMSNRCQREKWMPWDVFIKHIEMLREVKDEPHENSRDHHGPCCNHRYGVESGFQVGLPEGLRRTREILPTVSGRAADRPDHGTN